MTELVAAAVVAATPLLLAAMGGIVADRSGVFSVGLEGYMLAGAFGAVWGAHLGGAWAGLAIAMLAATGMAAIHAVLSISLHVNQIVSGLAINIFALGATGFLNETAFGLTGSTGIKVKGFSDWAIPGLSDIPVIGPALFDQTIFTYLAVVLLVLVVILFRSTALGLRIHAVGEAPHAAVAHGISVIRLRYAAVLYSGMAAGLGGAMLSIGQVDSFVTNITAGRGFIALAAVISGAWRPLGAAAACALFGLAEAGQIWSDVLGVNIPTQFLQMAPYLLTLVALAVIGSRVAMPKALGVPFRRERRG